MPERSIFLVWAEMPTISGRCLVRWKIIHAFDGDPVIMVVPRGVRSPSLVFTSSLDVELDLFAFSIEDVDRFLTKITYSKHHAPTPTFEIFSER